MILRSIASYALAICVAALAGCKQESSPSQIVITTGQAVVKVEPVAFPDLGATRLIQPGIKFQEATLHRGAMPMRVWYYQPEKAAEKLALVLVPPAGSTLFVGMDLGDGDRPEHYPYARAGFAVASFDIDGHVPNSETAFEAALL